MSAPIFTPSNRGGAWTIDADRTFVTYTGSFPRSYLDQRNWAHEPWSGRVLGVAFQPGGHGGLHILDPGARAFRPFGIMRAPDGGALSSVRVLPRERLTIVLSRDAWVLRDNRLEAWLSPEERRRSGIGDVRDVVDLPTFRATAILDWENRLFVKPDGGDWQALGPTSDNFRFMEPSELTASNAVLFPWSPRRLLLRFSANGPANGRMTAEIIPPEQERDATPAVAADRLGLVLRLTTPGVFERVWNPIGSFRWQRLTAHGFEDIAGGAIGRHGFPVQTLNRRPQALIRGRDGLYLYDGNRIAPIVGAGPETFRYEQSATGRVVLRGGQRLFELSEAGTLSPVHPPFALDADTQLVIQDWPEAGVLLFAAAEGLFALDGDFRWSAIRGGEMIGSPSVPLFQGSIPPLGEMLLASRRGLMLAVDTRRAGPGICEPRPEPN